MEIGKFLPQQNISNVTSLDGKILSQVEKGINITAKEDVQSQGICSETMARETDKTGLSDLFKGNISYNYYGKINEKGSDLKEEYSKDNIFGTKSHSKINGQIGGKAISYTQETNLGIGYRESVSEGNFDGKDFKLLLTTKMMGQSTLTGTINGEEVNIKFPSSKVPEDEYTNDLITTILMQNGYSVKLKDGEFKGLKLSTWNQKLAMAVQQQMAMQQQQMNSYNPTWHYDNPQAPTFY